MIVVGEAIGNRKGLSRLYAHEIQTLIQKIKNDISISGTTEGRIAVQTLEEAGKPFYYSTKGNEQEVPLHNGIRLQGGMDKDSLESSAVKRTSRC